MNKETQHLLRSSLVVALVTLPVMALVFVTNGDIALLFGVLGIVLLNILLFTRPLIGLAALLAIRPAIDSVGDRAVSFGSVSINVAGILSILVLVWSLWYLISQWKRVMEARGFWPIALFVGFGFFSLTYSVATLATMTEIVRLGSLLGLFFVAQVMIRQEQDFRTVISGLLLGLVLPSAVGFFQVLTGNGLTFAESVNRAYGTFGHPNVFAFYLVLTIFTILGLYAHGKRYTGIHPITVVLFTVLLLLTQTRGAWLGLVVGLGFVGLVRYRQALVVGSIVLLTILVILPLLSASLTSAGIDIKRQPIIGQLVERQLNTSSFDWRVEVWDDMKDRFFERPLFGFGLGSFPTLRQLQVFDVYDQGIGAHNDYLRLLVELGLIGCVLYALVLVSWLRAMRAITRHWSGERLFMMGFFLAFLVMSYFDNLLQATPVMWAFMILLGSLSGLSRKT